MKQRIYDTRLQETVAFSPRVDGEIGMYVCGPTVQSAPHIGHLRSALVYDQVRRWFTATGQRVTLIRNVTDIDDKILHHARIAQEAGGSEQWWALAYRVERDFTAAYDAIGVAPPSYEPRATASIPEMIALIELLISRGHAYVAQDGTASVYFDTASWSEYGALTHQRREQMEDAVDSEPVGKRDPRDFALWKAHREHEPASASWDSPWGRGRPGWHIECSAMATRYLGEEFDIHGGGLDLRFPHHENELAQSAAAGHGFARYWMHNGLVNTAGQKMSKSAGNSLSAHELLASARPIALRYFLGSAHYRSVLEYSPELLAEASAAFLRIEGFLDRAAQLLGERMPAFRAGTTQAADVPSAFADAMWDDFAVPQALATLHGAVRAGNVALGTHAIDAHAIDAHTIDAHAIDAHTIDEVFTRAFEVVSMLDVLGLDPRDPVWGESNTGSPSGEAALDTLVQGLIEQRAQARKQKNFAASDAIRDQLAQAGITLEDNPQGTRWSQI